MFSFLTCSDGQQEVGGGERCCDLGSCPSCGAALSLCLHVSRLKGSKYGFGGEVLVSQEGGQSRSGLMIASVSPCLCSQSLTVPSELRPRLAGPLGPHPELLGSRDLGLGLAPVLEMAHDLNWLSKSILGSSLPLHPHSVSL